MTLRCKGFKLYRLFVNVMKGWVCLRWKDTHIHPYSSDYFTPHPFVLSGETFFCLYAVSHSPLGLGGFRVSSLVPRFKSHVQTHDSVWRGKSTLFIELSFVFFFWLKMMFGPIYCPLFYFFCTVMSIINVIIIVVFACSSNCQHDMQ